MEPKPNLKIKATLVKKGELDFKAYDPFEKLCFVGNLKSDYINLDVIQQQIENGKFSQAFQNGGLIITTDGGVIIKLNDNFENEMKKFKEEFLKEIRRERKWEHVGVLKDIDKIMNDYPITQYEYGMSYNQRTIEKVIVSGWNRGIRVWFANMVPHNDNATLFHAGNCIFTKGTDDPESKDKFYHRYVDANFKPCCGSNGNCDESKVWVKKF